MYYDYNCHGQSLACMHDERLLTQELTGWYIASIGMNFRARLLPPMAGLLSTDEIWGIGIILESLEAL